MAYYARDRQSDRLIEKAACNVFFLRQLISGDHIHTSQPKHAQPQTITPRGQHTPKDSFGKTVFSGNAVPQQDNDSNDRTKLLSLCSDCSARRDNRSPVRVRTVSELSQGGFFANRFAFNLRQVRYLGSTPCALWASNDLSAQAK
jgi:hypothetical protein